MIEALLAEAAQQADSRNGEVVHRVFRLLTEQNHKNTDCEHCYWHRRIESLTPVIEMMGQQYANARTGYILGGSQQQYYYHRMVALDDEYQDLRVRVNHAKSHLLSCDKFCCYKLFPVQHRSFPESPEFMSRRMEFIENEKEQRDLSWYDGGGK